MMIDVVKSDTFAEWLDELRDKRAVTAIVSRLDRLSFGHAGDAKLLRHGIYELRIHYGSGYRVYYKRSGNTLIIVLCGGDKSTQDKDIELAHQLAKDWSEKP